MSARQSTPARQPSVANPASSGSPARVSRLHSTSELPIDSLVERGRALGHRPAISTDGSVGWSPAPIRRDIPHKKYTGEHADAVQAYADQLNTAVQKAAAAILASPRLGAYSDFDGHTSRWVDLITHLATQRKDPGGLAAAFGYAVESLATGPLLPAPPGGMTVALQGSRGGTRPDLILVSAGTDVAWLDITASASSGHILQKEGGWDQAPSYAEITYPSLDVSSYSAMADTAGSDPDKELDFEGVDAKAAFAAAAAAKAALEVKRQKWGLRAKDLLQPVLSISVRGSNDISGPGLRRERATAILAAWLGLPGLEQKTAASVIWALGPNPVTYGFLDNVSYGTGLAVLQDADPSVG